MCRNTKIALFAAMVFGATCIAPANRTLAEDSYNFEPGVANSEWIVQGDTWIRREELFGNTYPGKTNPLATVPSGQPSARRASIENSILVYFADTSPKVAHACGAPSGLNGRNQSCEHSSSLRPQPQPYSLRRRSRSQRAKALRRSRMSLAPGSIRSVAVSHRRFRDPARWSTRPACHN
jgi:hypothetical protein